MKRYVFHLVMACALGFCSADPEDAGVDQGRCICKPVMRLEWEPSSSLCNNETFDWLLQMMMSQVNQHKEILAANKDEITTLQHKVDDKDNVIKELQQKLNEKNQELKNVKSENTDFQQQMEDVREHRAHLKPRPHDCADVQRYGFHYSGIYTIYPPTLEQGIEVFCDLNTDGGGWLVFQRRQDGSQDFAKLWEDYKWGFGKLAKEFWLGNENLHVLTGLRDYEMRVDLTDYLGKRYYAMYDSIVVDNEKNKYTLHVGNYEGTAGDAMAHHNKAPFSTTDSDNDKSRSGNCAELYGGGGWWWVRCYDSNLNGLYSERHLYETIVWYQLRRNHEPMRHAEMKIRPKNFK